MTDQFVKITEIQRLKLKSDELLIIKVPSTLPSEVQKQLSSFLNLALKGASFMVVPDTFDFKIIKKAHLSVVDPNREYKDEK